jgi:RNA polymerase sigma factor (sigma-70 family)
MKPDETKPRGAPASFDALYAEHSNRIYRFCYRLCGHPVDAEDLAQEVFLAAYQGLSGFAGRSSLTTWLYRIAIYRWQRVLKQYRASNGKLWRKETETMIAAVRRLGGEDAVKRLTPREIPE